MRVSATEGYSLWAPVYDSAINPLRALERRAMRSALKGLHPSTVIDVACGTGQWLLHFQQNGSKVFGCDISEEMLREARKIASLRARVALANAEHIPFRCGTANLILCSLSVGYFPGIRRAFSEFARVSRAAGLIAVSDLHPDAITYGWTRSFRLGEQRYEIEHRHRTMREIDDAAVNAGLRCRLSRPIYFGAPELPLFQRAGKEKQFPSIASIPALFVGLWEKPC
ncbi:MAG TPA: class I SAM-dependent methyltransferase [Bryobacteraceae bacterium]|nr:class I SAM-dependent methyltransferase [Bryobacteraceae bacterium]